MVGKCYVLLLFLWLVIEYRESFFKTSYRIIFKHRVTVGNCDEICIVLLVSYRVSGVLLSDLILYNL